MKKEQQKEFMRVFNLPTFLNFTGAIGIISGFYYISDVQNMQERKK